MFELTPSTQGPRSNFEIGGTISASKLGGHKTLFLTNSLYFKNIEGHVLPGPPTPRSLQHMRIVYEFSYSYRTNPLFHY